MWTLDSDQLFVRLQGLGHLLGHLEVARLSLLSTCR